MAGAAEQTAELEDWRDVEGSATWPTLLVGNGASINIWSKFNYKRLYEQAQPNLSNVAKAVFSELGVENFEMVLEAIHHAHVVVEALDNSTEDIDMHYEHVKSALFDAVRSVHVDRFQFTNEKIDKIGSVFQRHDAIYTTNYDICTYWARLDYWDRLSTVERRTKREVVDFFWSGSTFDPDKVGIWRDGIPMYHLHGAIHLWQNDRGDNGKWTRTNGEDLLSLADRYSPESPKWPLFVSEGTWKAKLQTIGRSPYLKFCLDSLRADC